MVKIFKRRKLIDEDADWVPQKGRAFKMKTEKPKEEPKKEQQVLTQGAADQRDKIKTDAEGMDRAYAPERETKSMLQEAIQKETGSTM